MTAANCDGGMVIDGSGLIEVVEVVEVEFAWVGAEVVVAVGVDMGTCIHMEVQPLEVQTYIVEEGSLEILEAQVLELVLDHLEFFLRCKEDKTIHG